MGPQPRRRSPRRDKDLDYVRQSPGDIVPGSRGYHQWVKKSVHRSYRRETSTALAQPDALADRDAAHDAEERLGRVRRTRVWSERPPALGDRVTERLFSRFLDTVDTFSATGYRRATQRARTVRALAALVRDRPTRRPTSVRLARVALWVDALLPEPVRSRTGKPHEVPGPPELLKRRRAWFAAFLDDQPQWRPRLVHWVTDHTRD